MENCKDIQKLLNKLANVIYDSIWEPHISYNIYLTTLKASNVGIEFNLKILELYNKSIEENFFWQYCTLKTYKHTYQERFNVFINNNPDANENEFIDREITLMFGNELVRERRDIFVYRFDCDTEIDGIAAINLDFLDDETVIKIKSSLERKMEFLEMKLNSQNEPEKSKDSSNAEQIRNVEQNPYPRIFLNRKSFELFEHWHNQVTERTQLAEYSFIYWAMVKDKIIYEDVRPTEFINFLNNEYQVALSELKQYNNCKGGGKESKYSTVKKLYKP